MLFSFIWKTCITQIKNKLSHSEFKMWILPLQAEFKNKILFIYAPNQLVFNQVQKKYIQNIKKILNFYQSNFPNLILKIGNKSKIKECKNKQSETNKTNILIPTNLKFFKLKPNVNCSNKTFNDLNINLKNDLKDFTKSQFNLLFKATTVQIRENNIFLIYKNIESKKYYSIREITKNSSKKVIFTNSKKIVQNILNNSKEKIIENLRFHNQLKNIALINNIKFFINKNYPKKKLFCILKTFIKKCKKKILITNYYLKKINGIENQLKLHLNLKLNVPVNYEKFKIAWIVVNQKKENKTQIKNKLSFFIIKYPKSKLNIKEFKRILNQTPFNTDFHFTNKQMEDNVLNKISSNLIFLKKKLLQLIIFKKLLLNIIKLNFLIFFQNVVLNRFPSLDK